MRKSKTATISNKKYVFQSSNASENIKYSSNLIGPTLSTSKSIIAQNNLKFSYLSPEPTNKKNKNNLYDIKKTFSLNLDIIKSYIKQSTSVNTLLNKDKDILFLIQKLQNSYKNKFALIKKIKDNKSKILIDTQIFYEKKRKSEENKEFYKQKIKESEEGVDCKEEYIKVLQNKLKEVEIYIHRITKDMKSYSLRRKYQKFTVVEFLENFDIYAKTKDKLKIDIKKIKEDIKLEKKNIKEYKIQKNKSENDNRIELIKNNNNLNYNLNVNNKNNVKIQNYISKYKNNIKKIYLRINLLKNNYNILNKRCTLFRITNLYTKTNDILDNKKKLINENNKKDEDDEKEKSHLALDLTKKLSNYMDFSSILNNKTEESQIDITKAGNNFEVITTTNVWDVSEINKKDI